MQSAWSSDYSSYKWTQEIEMKRSAILVFGVLSILFALTLAFAPSRKEIQEQAAKEARELEEDTQARLKREARDRQSEAQSRVAEQQQELKRLEDEKSNALDAESLVSRYEFNEVRADLQFKGKEIAVQGKVERVGKDILNNPFVTLAGSTNGIASVQCMFSKGQESQLADLFPGQKIHLRGTIGGKMMNILMRNCKII